MRAETVDASQAIPAGDFPQPLAAGAAATQSTGPHCSCGEGEGSQPSSYVYAVGHIEPRFPSQSIHRELAQLAARDSMNGTNAEVLSALLTKPENRYLARRLCWVFLVGGMETYILLPREPADLDLLLQCTRPDASPLDLDVVIGVRGPLAPPALCNGLTLPVVALTQVYSFGRAEFLKEIPAKGKGSKDDSFRRAAAELFDRIIQMAHNTGATDGHRAMNYLAVRYPKIYAQTAQAHADGSWLTAVTPQSSHLGGVRKIVEVVFSYTNRQTDFVEKFAVSVDVTEEFPFLASKLGPYFDH